MLDLLITVRGSQSYFLPSQHRALYLGSELWCGSEGQDSFTSSSA